MDSVTAEEKAALIKGASELLLGVRLDLRDHRGGRDGQLGLRRFAGGGISPFAARENRLTHIISASRVLASDGFPGLRLAEQPELGQGGHAVIKADFLDDFAVLELKDGGAGEMHLPARIGG